MTIGMVLSLALSITLAATAIILHELAHGYAALALGDDTAQSEGRLSLNPLSHVDRVGTVLLPGILLLGQLLTTGRVLFMFGWAKPVPVDPSRFAMPRQMMALVALAGPAMNAALAFLAAHVLLIHDLPAWAVDAVLQFMALNLALGLFNLIPLPPLDGGRIIVGLLPARLAVIWSQIEPFGIFIVLAIVAGPPLLRQAGIDIDPLGASLMPAVEWSITQMLALAGVH